MACPRQRTNPCGVRNKSIFPELSGIGLSVALLVSLYRAGKILRTIFGKIIFQNKIIKKIPRSKYTSIHWYLHEYMENTIDAHKKGSNCVYLLHLYYVHTPGFAYLKWDFFESSVFRKTLPIVNAQSFISALIKFLIGPYFKPGKPLLFWATDQIWGDCSDVND